MNDVQKSDLISFDQYLIFFDETFGNHHHITCTLSRFNGKDYSPISKFQNFILFRHYFALKYTCIHENVGYKQVQTGGNGCGWVQVGALGRRGHGGHKKQGKRGHLWSQRREFGCYGRGNFPGHHVLEKYEKTCMNHSKWVCMGEYGWGRVNTNKGEQKQVKTKNNYVIRTCFPEQ